MINLSIIIPLYNGEKYISTCLESIIGQELDGIEIIIIDNASTDRSIDIVEQYMKKFKNIRLIRNKRNHGPGVARNIGINKALGKYITFVDCDDYVSKDMYLNMYNYIEKYSLDCVVCEYDYVHNNDNLNSYSKQCDSIQIVNKIQAVQQFLKGEIECYSWNKLYKRKYLLTNQVFFSEEIFTGEDVIFLAKVIVSSNKIGFSSNRFYKYRRHLNSITSSIDNQKVIEHNSALIETIDYLKRNLSEYEKEYLELYEVRNTVAMFIKYVQLYQFDRKKIYDNYHNHFKSLCKNLPMNSIFRNKIMNPADKIRFFLLKYKQLDRYVKIKLKS
ncbi:MAG: glycosyltransferase family 2 protein [Turicibacter sp.]|nr:glycosyltransferase family 2 protein [Turicibacter sp.]